MKYKCRHCQYVWIARIEKPKSCPKCKQYGKIIKLPQNIGDKNGQWKGDDVGLSALHEWIKNRLVKPQVCDNCHKEKYLDLANISQEYKRDLNDWEWLCRRCHMIKDGRANFLPNYNKGRGAKTV